jgi:hypothetical protein
MSRGGKSHPNFAQIRQKGKRFQPLNPLLQPIPHHHTQASISHLLVGIAAKPMVAIIIAG